MYRTYRTLVLSVVLFSVLLNHTCCADEANSTITLQESIYRLGPRLYKHYFKKDVTENLIASPLGLSLGLGLIQLAGSDELKSLILRDFFKWKDSELDFHRNLSTIQKKYQKMYVENVTELATTEPQVNVHCAIFHQEGINMTEEFQQYANNDYDAQFISLNERCVLSDYSTVTATKCKQASYMNMINRKLVLRYMLTDRLRVSPLARHRDGGISKRATNVEIPYQYYSISVSLPFSARRLSMLGLGRVPTT